MQNIKPVCGLLLVKKSLHSMCNDFLVKYLLLYNFSNQYIVPPSEVSS